MKDKTYIMIGMPIISKEVFRKILRPLNNYSFKPSGGFWASEHNGNICNISDWYNYLLNADSIARYKNMNQSVIFTLKESANILFIDSQEQILKLASLYPSYHHILGYYKETTSNSTIFDFETLQEEYDGIYINYNKIYNSNKTIVFDDWKSNTLLLFNLNCIKRKYHI